MFSLVSFHKTEIIIITIICILRESFLFFFSSGFQTFMDHSILLYPLLFLFRFELPPINYPLRHYFITYSRLVLGVLQILIFVVVFISSFLYDACGLLLLITSYNSNASRSPFILLLLLLRFSLDLSFFRLAHWRSYRRSNRGSYLGASTFLGRQ